MVTVAVLAVLPGLTETVNVTLPLFEPDAALTVNHASELTTFQSVFEVIVNVAVLLLALTLNVEGETNKAGAVPGCVIVTVSGSVVICFQIVSLTY